MMRFLHKKGEFAPYYTTVTCVAITYGTLGESRFRNPGKLLLVESGILGFGILNTAERIRNLTSDWNPESNFR